MYTVKPQFNGASVNYQNKKVVLNDKLSESAKAEMISSGLSRYFVDNPTVEKAIPVVKLQVIKKGANGDAIEAGFNETADKANAGENYSKKTVADLKAIIDSRKLDAGTAKTKAELIEVIETADKANA